MKILSQNKKFEINEKEMILEFSKKITEIFLFSLLSDFPMNAKFGVYIAIAVGIAVAIGFFGTQNGGVDHKNSVFHVTLANTKNYEGGVFTDSFEIEEGTYAYRFVPNGDSPQNLIISLDGESIHYLENFILKGTPHKTAISTYYTWGYSGNIGIKIPKKQEVKITIDPNGNLLGPVSVDIIKIK